MAESIGKWMTGEQLPDRKDLKTHCWRVRNLHGGSLGIVEWYPSWRQYEFVPDPGTGFSNGCLRDLAAFLDRCNAEQREKKS